MIEKIEKGEVATVEKSYNISDVPWNKHPTFDGVFLKHLIKGDCTEGKFSCHLVRVQAGCQLADHVHQNNWELHEVVSGKGKGFVNEKEISYIGGTAVIIPQGQNHRVAAGEEDLYLLAKFIPALL